MARGRFGMGVCPFLGLVCDATGASQASAIQINNTSNQLTYSIGHRSVFHLPSTTQLTHEQHKQPFLAL